MTEELTELHEHAEHAREHPDLAPITLTMAVLAVLVATVSLLGHRTHTEEIILKNEEVLLQNKVTDQWAYYQAKNIRRHNDELFVSDMRAIVTHDSATELFRGGLEAGIQLLDVRHRSATTQTDAHYGPAWLAAHSRYVAKVARHRFPADPARRCIGKVMHPFDHGIAGVE